MRSTLSFARGVAARGVSAALLTAFVALGCAACGQRGPLYLPDSAPERVEPAEEAAPGGAPETPDADDATDDATDDEERQ